MSKTKQKILIIIVLFLVVLFGVGQFFAYSNLSTTTSSQNQSGASQPQPPTQVITYVPPAPASSTPVEQGSCWTNSVAAPYRSDAWRCTVGNAISDPCFEAQGSDELVCNPNPAGVDTSSTFALQLTKPLPKPETPPGATPSNWSWLVELGDGTICTPFTGTLTPTSQGLIGYYSCDGAVPNEDMIFGQLNASSTTWTALVGAVSQATSTFPPPIVFSSTVPVFAVWQ